MSSLRKKLETYYRKNQYSLLSEVAYLIVTDCC